MTSNHWCLLQQGRLDFEALRVDTFSRVAHGISPPLSDLKHSSPLLKLLKGSHVALCNHRVLVQLQRCQRSLFDILSELPRSYVNDEIPDCLCDDLWHSGTAIAKVKGLGFRASASSFSGTAMIVGGASVFFDQEYTISKSRGFGT